MPKSFSALCVWAFLLFIAYRGLQRWLVVTKR